MDQISTAVWTPGAAGMAFAPTTLLATGAATGPTGATGASGTGINKLTGVFTANGTLGTIPAGAVIIAGSFLETAGHTVSVSLGTAAAGAQVVAITAVTGSSISPIQSATLLLSAWKADQVVYVASAAWGSASITATIWYAS